MVKMKNESVVLFISEMNIDVEMNIRNKLEMKHHNELEMKHHKEMKHTSQWK